MGPTTAWLDMSAYDHTVTRSVYLVVLSKDEPSPIAPQSDEEGKPESPPDVAGPADEKSPKAGTEDQDKAKAKGAKPTPPPAPRVKIDFANIDQRILALPIPAKNYVGIQAGKTGELFVIDLPPGQDESDAAPGGGLAARGREIRNEDPKDDPGDLRSAGVSRLLQR